MLHDPQKRIRWLLLAGLGLFLFIAGFFHVSDVDVGYHMRTAEHILSGNGIPTTNTFAHTTPDQPWLLHQWLGTLIFYIPYCLFGVTGLVAFKALIGAVTMLLVWYAASRLAGPGSLWPYWAVTLGVMVARVRFFERSDLLSALFCALLFLLDDRYRSSRRWQWLGLPLLVAFWANVHAGVIYGIVLLAAWWGSECVTWILQRLQAPALSKLQDSANPAITVQALCVRPVGILLAAALSCLTVQLFNPNGCQVLLFPIAQFRSSFWQTIIVEYQAPTWTGFKLFYLTLAGMILLQIVALRRLNLRLLFGTAAFGYLACTSQRSMLFFCIPAIPHAAFLLERVLPSSIVLQSVTRVLLLPLVWLALAAFVILPNPSFRFGPGFYAPYYPMEIYSFMDREVAPQRFFNDMRYGGSMLWWLYPRFKPFIDGRGDAYSETFWKTEYWPVLDAASGWQDVLRKYDVHGVLLAVSESRVFPGLAFALHNDQAWALVAFNDDTLLFLERTPVNHTVISRHEFRYLWPGDRTLFALNDPVTRGQAMSEARRALVCSPDSQFARTAAARACFLNEAFGEASRLLGLVVRESIVNETYLRDYGYALFRSGQLAAADRVFARMIRDRQMPAFACYMRHFIALSQNRPAKARVALQRAIDAEPGNATYREAMKDLDLLPPIR